MAKSVKWILLVVAIIAAIFLFTRKKSGNAVPKVAVEQATKRSIIETVSGNGRIYPETEVRVSPDFAGQVTELKVAEGDNVKKGQLLARINDRTSIESPIDGVVLSVKVKKGESVTGNNFSAGTEMFVIADMSLLEIRVDVGENDIVKINNGDSADITVDAYGLRKFKGTVTRIANTVKTNGTSYNTQTDVTNYEVRIRLDSNSYADLADRKFPFRPGMNASTEIKTMEKAGVITVPIAAVTTRAHNSSASAKPVKDSNGNTVAPGFSDLLEDVVFVLQKDETVKKVVVKTGIQDISYFEITSGLHEGEQVVTGPYIALSKNLQDGMKVKVVPRDKLFEQ